MDINALCKLVNDFSYLFAKPTEEARADGLEHGGTLCLTKDKEIRLANPCTGTSCEIKIADDCEKEESWLGSYHTHQRHASPSIGDIFSAIEEKEPISCEGSVETGHYRCWSHGENDFTKAIKATLDIYSAKGEESDEAIRKAKPALNKVAPDVPLKIGNAIRLYGSLSATNKVVGDNYAYLEKYAKIAEDTGQEEVLKIDSDFQGLLGRLRNQAEELDRLVIQQDEVIDWLIDKGAFHFCLEGDIPGYPAG